MTALFQALLLNWNLDKYNTVKWFESGVKDPEEAEEVEFLTEF